jgi:hypothetical protein
MNRRIEPEWLDDLPASDPRAIGSRRDLQRLNRWMGNARIMAQALRLFPSAARPLRVVELGAGDGEFCLRVAYRLGCRWRGAVATLVDRQSPSTGAASRSLRELGWEVEVTKADAFEWCRHTRAQSREVILANLFLHHFNAEQLKELLRGIAQRSCFFVAVEPRRSRLALVFSRSVTLIGCNAVTRHDAPASVRAGFAGQELSRLWPGNGEWKIRERPAGPFSHLFVAQKRN